MAEMLPAGFEDPAKWWTPVNMACETIGAEMGVDFIKSTYTVTPKAEEPRQPGFITPIVVLGGRNQKTPQIC